MRRAETLREALEQDIVTGKFRPGDRLDEQSLAARFEVSRTPIREALMQLASTGLVELQARRGAFVASLSFKDVVERFEVMAGLEGMCGALAARPPLWYALMDQGPSSSGSTRPNFVVGNATTGGWSVVPGSGTEDYVGLKGGGHVVGVNQDDPVVDLIDSYSGSLRL